MLVEFGQSLFIADGPSVDFMGFDYPTRMAVAKLAEGGLWIWSPIKLTEQSIAEVNSLGSVKYIVSPNKIHHIFLNEWAGQWPEALLYTPPGLVERKPDIHFDRELADEAPPEWRDEIDQVIFRGSFAMEEVVFFHRISRTAIVCDLIQRHNPDDMKGFKGMLMRLDGLVGDKGSTPREWRASFLKRGPARAAREKVLNWNAEKLLIAHGKCVHSDASSLIEKALDWI